MASLLPRLRRLGQEDKSFLFGFFNLPEVRALDLPQDVLEQIDKTGKLPPELENLPDNLKASFERAKSVVAGLPSNSQVLRDITTPESIEGEAGLTEEQSRERLDEIQELQPRARAEGEKASTDFRDFSNHVTQILTEISNSQSRIKVQTPDTQGFQGRESNVADLITKAVLNQGMNFQTALSTIAKLPAGAPNSFKELFQERTGRSVESFALPPGVDVSADIDRLTGQVGALRRERVTGETLSRFLKETPEELKESREQFLQTQEAGAEKFLRSRVPGILGALNVKGLATGPDVGGVITGAGGRLQSRIEENIRNIEEQDTIFFADAAYRLTLSRLESSESEFRLKTSAERAKASQEQGQAFKSGQADISRGFELDFLKSLRDKNINLAERDISFATSEASKRLRDQLISDIGLEAGKTTGTVVGSQLSEIG